MKNYIAALVLVLGFGTVSANASEQSLQLAQSLISEAIFENEGIEDPNNEVRIEFLRGKAQLLSLTTDNIDLASIELNKKSGVFQAQIIYDGAHYLNVNGRYSEITQVPAPGRKIFANEIISDEDIIYIELEAKKLKRGYIVSEFDLIGKTPKRALLAGRPVLPSLITEPAVVKKDQPITLSYSNNLLHIQDAGVAMERGTVGETIRIKNANSNRVVRAKVIDEKTAQIEVTTNYASN